MKRLLESTINSYDSIKLARHLDKLSSSQFRVDFQHLTIHVWTTADNQLADDLEIPRGNDCYVYYCSIIDFNKSEIIEAIEDVYFELGM